MRGRFIVVDGPDGSGTTLHVALLSERLRAGRTVFSTAEPSSGPVGLKIREMLSNKISVGATSLQLLFCADRAWHVEHEVSPHLEAGETVISDRYALSTLAYGEALGLDVAWLESVNARFPRPDAQILLLPPLSVCMERLGKRESHDALEGESLQSRVHDAYRGLARRDPSIAVLDSSGPEEETARLIDAALRVRGVL